MVSAVVSGGGVAYYAPLPSVRTLRVCHNLGAAQSLQKSFSGDIPEVISYLLRRSTLTLCFIQTLVSFLDKFGGKIFIGESKILTPDVSDSQFPHDAVICKQITGYFGRARQHKRQWLHSIRTEHRRRLHGVQSQF